MDSDRQLNVVNEKCLGSSKGSASSCSLGQMYWFPRNVPHRSFIIGLPSWLVGRLSTQDRLLSWGLGMDARYIRCHNGNESGYHFFFLVKTLRLSGTCLLT